MKKIRYLLEAGLLYFLFAVFGALPVDAASACGGWIGRTVGSCLNGATRKALNNVRQALPGRSEKEYRAIISGMWDNLGRLIAEYPHLKKIGRDRVEIINRSLVEKLVHDKQSAVLITGHIANWEAFVAAAQIQIGLAMDVIYRAPNNPWVNRLLNNIRSQNGGIVTIPKSRSSVRAMVAALSQGRYIGMLIDQKYNEGVPVSFFGRPAMTSPAYVQLAQKFKCPLIPGQIERLNGARFRVTVHEPMSIFAADGQPRPAEDVMEESHRLLESWISARPEQWLWLHRRWNSAAFKT